jgi:hypothetical protein
MLIAPVIAAITSINGGDDDDGTFSEGVFSWQKFLDSGTVAFCFS